MKEKKLIKNNISSHLRLTKKDITVIIVLIRELFRMHDTNYLRSKMQNKSLLKEPTAQDMYEHFMHIFKKAKSDPIRIVKKLCSVYEETKELGLTKEQMKRYLKNKSKL